MTPDFVSFSSIIIDDIVLSNGRTFMNTLGGAGTHALVGMRVWSDRLGYAAAVGDDFDPTHRQLLESLGVDMRAVMRREGHRTARAWQLFEPDERRIEVFRTDRDDFERYKPQLEELPEDYLAAKGFHIHWGTCAEVVELVRKLRAINPTMCLLWEPSPPELKGTPDEFQAVCSEVDLVSPDTDEARILTGETTVQGMIERFLSWGVPLVALRMGAKGSLVGASGGKFYRAPAVPATIVDVTGAGDAYCGGFLVGLGMGEDTAQAAARAAVSASFALEQFGVPRFDEAKRVEAEWRLAWARDRIEVSAAALP